MDHDTVSGQRVLIVEDEIVVAIFMEDLLAELGYEVAGVVCHVEDALARSETPDFALAVLDVHLNGKDVFAFADRLAQMGKPFVFATGYGARGIPEEFRGHLVLQKPFGPVELRRALMDLSGQAR